MRRIPFLEVAATRSFAGLPLVLVYARLRRTSLRIHNRCVDLLRVVAGTAAMGQTFYALATIPLAGLSAPVGQFAMTRAHALDVAARGGGVNDLNILASLLLASFLFGERPAPLAAGIAAILLAGSLLVWTGRREAAQAAYKDP